MLNFVIDPPWPKQKGNLRKVRPNQSRSLDYETLSVQEIFALLDREIFPSRTISHNIWLWVVDEFLHEAESNMIGRDYRLHARMIWSKGNGPAPAFTIRYSHEYVLWFYRPKLEPIAKEARGKYTTVFSDASREHSRKPDSFYQMIDTFYPDSERVDIFSREERKGWKQFGNETNKFTAQDRAYETLLQVMKL